MAFQSNKTVPETVEQPHLNHKVDLAVSGSPPETLEQIDLAAPRPSDADYRSIRRQLIVKFLAFWFLSLALIYGLALLSNIEWSRRFVEGALSESLHRKVKLGRLYWNFGFNGLSIASDRLVVREMTEVPFLVSGPAEIGIAFMPLFRQRLIIKHLIFKKPEVCLIKLSRDQWNFSDLITTGPEIRFVQIEDGILHLINMEKPESKSSPNGNQSAPPTWQKYDLDQVNLKLTLPRYRPWPGTLSFRTNVMAEDGKLHQSQLKLDFTGAGGNSDWTRQEYSFKLEAKNVNPQKWRELVPQIPDIHGLIDLQAKGKGSWPAGVVADAQVAARNFWTSMPNDRKLELAAVEASSQINISPEKVQWQGLRVSMPNLHLDSQGHVLGWQNDRPPSYHARVGGKLKDLRQFFAAFLGKAKSGGAWSEKFIEPQGPTGQAEVEMVLQGNDKVQTTTTHVKAEAIPLSALMVGPSASPIISMFKIDPRSHISGDITFSTDKGVEIKDLIIPLEGAPLKISGNLNESADDIDLHFEGKGISFETLRQHAPEQNVAFKRFFNAAGSFDHGITVSGAVDVSGRLKIQAKKTDVTLKAKIYRASVRSGKHAVLLSNMQADVDYDGKTLAIDKLKALLPDAGQNDNEAGQIKLQARLPLSISNPVLSTVKMDCQLEDVSIERLLDLSGAVGINPLADKHLQATGKLQRLQASITGPITGALPGLKINCLVVPELISLRPTAAASMLHGPVKLKNGEFEYKDNNLSVRDVTAQFRTGAVTLTAELSSLMKQPNLRSVKMKSDGMDLAELKPYVSTCLGIGGLARVINGALDQVDIGSLHGRAYWDLALSSGEPTADVQGVIGFANAGFKFGDQKRPVERLAGLLTINRNAIVLHSLKGEYGESEFFFDGSVRNPRSDEMRWSLEMRGQLAAQQVNDLFEYFDHDWRVFAQPDGTLAINAKAYGSKKEYNFRFNGQIPSDAHLALKTHYALLHQPARERISFDGMATFKVGAQGEALVKKCAVQIGENLLNCSGRYQWFAEETKRSPNVELYISTPYEIAVGSALQLISPGIDVHGSKGTIKFSGTLAGPLDDLLTHGMLTINQVSLPAFRIDKLTGEIESPLWSLINPSAKSKAEVRIQTVNLGGLNISDAKADLKIITTPLPRIVIEGATAAVEGGTTTLDGWLEPESGKQHYQLSLQKLQVDAFLADLIEHTNKDVSGVADIALTLNTRGLTREEWLNNLKGSGRFNVYSATVVGIGSLQEKLNAANLLQQGIFGFNINNLIQTVMPVKTGQFQEISGLLSVKGKKMLMHEVFFDGLDLRMRAAGRANLETGRVDVKVAGNIPRVTNSILPGAFGEMSKKFTLQKFLHVATFGKLNNLPSLPILGDIASDDPRAFAFICVGPVTDVKALSQSIEKTFHWLPNRPLASAHPLPEAE